VPPVKSSSITGILGEYEAQQTTSRGIELITEEPEGLKARAGGQSGALQGLPDIAVADSESVSELIEEGNAREAEIVMGLEEVSDADEGEIIAHEMTSSVKR
jgi:hypothetical protein